MVINENLINRIVTQEILNMMCESVNLSTIGQNGSVEPKLLDPHTIFYKEYRMMRDIQAQGTYVDIPTVFKDTTAYKVYTNYFNAMTSKSDKKARNFFGWLKSICTGKLGCKILAYKEGDNYLFGYWLNGFFISAYFAPSNTIGMFRILSSICQYDNVIFPVTQDLSGMLSRLGLKKSNNSQTAKWWGGYVQKDVFGTSDEAIQFGIKALKMLLNY